MLTTVIVILAFTMVVVSEVVEDGGIYSRTILACLALAFACFLLRLITGMEVFAIFIKVCGVVAVISATIAVLISIFSKDNKK